LFINSLKDEFFARFWLLPQSILLPLSLYLFGIQWQTCNLFLEFGCLAINLSVVWPIFIRLFGDKLFGCLADLQGSVCRGCCSWRVVCVANVVNEALDIDSPAEHDGDVQKKDLRKMWFCYIGDY
jgi:hypothetical protein